MNTFKESQIDTLNKLMEENELAEADLYIALKKCREEKAYLSIDRIVEIIKEVLGEEASKEIKEKL